MQKSPIRKSLPWIGWAFAMVLAIAAIVLFYAPFMLASVAAPLLVLAVHLRRSTAPKIAGLP